MVTCRTLARSCLSPIGPGDPLQQMQALKLGLQLHFGQLAGGHILQGPAHAHHLPVLHHRVRDGAHPFVLALRIDEFEFQIIGRAVRQRLLQGSLDEPARFAGVELQAELHVGLGQRVDAMDAGNLRRPAAVAGGRVEFPTADLCQGSGLLQKVLAIPQPFIGLRKLGGALPYALLQPLVGAAQNSYRRAPAKEEPEADQGEQHHGRRHYPHHVPQAAEQPGPFGRRHLGRNDHEGILGLQLGGVDREQFGR